MSLRAAVILICALFIAGGCASEPAAGTGGSTGGATIGGDSGSSASSSGASASGSDSGTTSSVSSGSGSSSGSIGSSSSSGSASSSGSSSSGSTGAACTTRITYGDTWIHGSSHPTNYDIASGTVTWDGVCTPDGTNSYAQLSNGWKPYFTGTSGCLIALDSSCSAASCATRVSYGADWMPPANHANFYDDVSGRVWRDTGTCVDHGSTVSAELSNGWTPYFNGNGCEVSLRYTQCGGLYENSLLDSCADPGVLLDGNRYVLACTSGNATNAFAIRTSPDLVTWTSVGHIFPSAQKPTWAASDFWAPEIHKVGSHYVAYFTARGTDGKLAIGAATSASATGPFTDLGQPLVHDANMGMIDASEFEDASGNPYLVWKADGNAVGQPTPIYGQALNAAGTALSGSRVTLITNDLSWEGPLVEGPWVVRHGGEYFLFYSGNSYANATYAVGVAKSSSPLGSYTKHGAPILGSDVAWKGPGHCSVLSTPAGNWAMVYHAWQAGHVNGAGDARHLLVDGIVWSNGWPSVPAAPSLGSRPMP